MLAKSQSAPRAMERVLTPSVRNTITRTKEYLWQIQK
nr:MAG TPA: hypothetical protein [Caudoviricetes sp.]